MGRAEESKDAAFPTSLVAAAERAALSEEDRECQPVVAEVGEPPGGGPGWVQVLVAHLEFFNTFGYIHSYSLLKTYYLERLGLDLSAVSWAVSVYGFLLLLVGAFSGRLYDAGHFRPLLALGSLAQVLGVFMISLAAEYRPLVLAQAVCGGIGAGLAYHPVLTNASAYFERRRIVVILLATAGTSTGGMTLAECFILASVVTKQHPGLFAVVRQKSS